MASSALLGWNLGQYAGTKSPVVPLRAASSPVSLCGCRSGRIRLQSARLSSRFASATASDDLRSLSFAKSEGFGSKERFREGWNFGQQRSSKNNNIGNRCEINALGSSRGQCLFSEKEDVEGFSLGLGSTRWQLQMWKKKKSSWSGERALVQAMARGGRRQDLSSGQEAGGDDLDENVSLPLIGEIPFTRKELRLTLTPMKILVWAVIATIMYSLLSFVSFTTVYNPLFWVYASWILIKWPWPAAILVGIATLYTSIQVRNRQPMEWEQVLILLGSLTWLILVPNGWFHGFVDGWPLVMFFVYIGFSLISAIVRYRTFLTLDFQYKDEQWEKVPSRLWQVGFLTCVAAAHWLAAYEAPFLLFSWNLSWRTILAVVIIAVASVTHYSGSYFLTKYSNRIVVPAAVVMFGPYRIVRHPIYASYMLLFAGYCLALRSYKSCLLLLAACILYYNQRTRLEEEKLVETFGQLYESYRERVSKKYFPFVY